MSDELGAVVYRFQVECEQCLHRTKWRKEKHAKMDYNVHKDHFGSKLEGLE